MSRSGPIYGDVRSELGRDYDVIVVGGGAAGIAASLAASRAGVRTLLLEKEDRFGGNVTQSYVHTICGLYENDIEEPRPINGGIPVEFTDYLQEKGVASEPRRVNRVHVVPIFPESFHRAVNDLLEEQANLEPRRGSPVSLVETDEPGWEVGFGGPRTLTRAHSDVLIDCTGDGVAAREAGATVEATPPDKLQLPSYIVKLSGVREEDTEGYGRVRLSRDLAQGVRGDALPAGVEAVLLRPGKESGTGYLTVNLPRDWDGPWEPLNPARVQKWTAEAKRRVNLIVDYLRGNRPGYKNCSVEQFPARIGIRESRRIIGREVITESDLIEGNVPEETVVYSSWPVELWHDYSGADFNYPEGRAGIPLGALVSRSHDRLGVAGRCLSATHEALGSLRVLGTSLSTGQAVGLAASRAVQEDKTLANVEAAGIRSRVKEDLNREDDC